MLVVPLVVVALLTAAATPSRAEILIGVAAPLTGPMSWAGGTTVPAVEFAVTRLNAAGGVLGEQIRIVTADDFCEAEQAVAAARKLVANGVVVVFGHECSGAAIPASAIYAEAGVLMMVSGATNPSLTEQGFRNVFRIGGRDDLQGEIAGDYLAKRWDGSKIAILHDGQAYGRALAENVKRSLNARGVDETMFAAIEPGLVDYFDVVKNIQGHDVDVLYYAGYSPEAGLLARQLNDRGLKVHLVVGDAIADEDYALIAGEAAEGTLMTTFPDHRLLPQAADMVADYRAEHHGASNPYVLLAYAAVQSWSLAVEQAGTVELEPVVETLRSNEFDTILGTIGFNDKGDITGYDSFAWYIWRGGAFEPLEPGDLTE